MATRALTQGRSRGEAYEMIKDLVETMASEPDFEVTVHPGSEDRFEIGANDVKTLVALLLRRQREKRGISLAEAAKLLEQKSRNAYARYEQGQTVPTIEKLEKLLKAIAPDQELVWRLGRPLRG
ncbi:MAG TPA: helix-turn-helix transcriptional regulator [Thermoanaerobaculia bacterium]